MGFSRQKARPEPPAKGRRSAGALQKRGLRDILKATAAAHPDKRLQLWFQDEARVGNKGRVCHRWWRRGERAPGDASNRLPVGLHLLRRAPGHRRRRHPGDAERQRQGHGPVSRTLRRYPGPGCARRHDVATAPVGTTSAPLTVPDNVTLALLPPYSPELNPVERVWLYLRERFLSLRVLDDTEAIINACCQAWIDFIAEPDRMRTLCAYPWIMKVIS